MATVPSALQCHVTLLVVISGLGQRCLCITDFSHIDHLRHFEPVYYDIQSLRHQHHVTRRSSSLPIKFEFRAFGREFTLNLKRDSTIHHPSMVVETEQGRSLYDSSRVYRGHLADDEKSQVHGVITKEGHFEGNLYLPNETYSIERAIHHFNRTPEFHTIIYRHTDITFNATSQTCTYEEIDEFSKDSVSHVTKGESSTDINDFEKSYSNWKSRYGEGMNRGLSVKNSGRKKRDVDPLKVTCELYVQADHLYYQKYGNNIDTVVDKLTQYVQAMTAIYRDIDFDGSGSPDNIGFVIKMLKIVTDPKAGGYKYPDISTAGYFLRKHSEDNYDEFCLSYLFTNMDFVKGVLGMAYTPGVCHRNTVVNGVGTSYNTGIVTELNYGTRVPFAVSQLTFAHEIGHNFGARHDPENFPTCAPGGRSGNYIMYSSAFGSSKPNNKRLSRCSISAIKPILERQARSTDGCFVEYKDHICGNHVVEGDEECDCGWADECEESCCNPQVSDPSTPGVGTPCTLKSATICSPSEGPCCSSGCQYSNKTTICRENSPCLEEAFCDGSSPRCPISQHKPDKTECGDDLNSRVCYKGECSRSICLAYGRMPCQCSPSFFRDWSDPNLCQLCCMDGDKCRSSLHLEGIPNKKVAAGTPCFDSQGYCDESKKCRPIEASDDLTILHTLLKSDLLNKIKTFLTNHWYVCVVAGAALVAAKVVYTKFCSRPNVPRGQVLLQPVAHVHHISGSGNQVQPNGWM